MGATNARAEIEVLPREECLRLLAAEEIGRIAVVLGNQPLIMPVNYVLERETIVLRTDPGTKLATANFERVAFEVDQVDRERQAGWSVLVQGVGQEITPAYSRLFEQVRALAITPWAPGDKEHWLRIMPVEISGRRVRPSVPS
jgi:nitroimidazol reductase NimA-like FMN-containing flavoprotein (pyridoxamine 5'-phosphate oxidase superfamily)